MKKKIISSLVAAFLCTFGLYLYKTYKKLTIITGHSSKYLCSCTFGSGRQAEDIINFDLNFSPISWAKYDIDYQNKKVTSTVFGMKANTAIFREGFGCTLLADYTEEELLKQQFPKSKKELYNDLLFDLSALTAKQKAMQKKVLKAIAPEFIEKDSLLPKNTTAITVAYDGKLIAEQYRKDFDYNTPLLGWSMTKSITSTLVGILVKEGDLDVHAPVDIPSWQGDERKNITLHHLLQMTSGLEWDENYTRLSSAVSMLYKEGDMYDYVIQSKLAHAPGTHWYYSSGTSNILSGIIKNQFDNDRSYWLFPYESLFDKLGMSSAWIEPDASGMYAGSSYCFATARDWTRYGLLYYNQGIWQGDTIVSPAWVNYTKSTSKAIPKGRYGAHWWLNIGKDGEYPLPGITNEVFYCKGYQGQRIYVIPSKKLVITRFGKTFNEDAFKEVDFLKRVFDACM